MNYEQIARECGATNENGDKAEGVFCFTHAELGKFVARLSFTPDQLATYEQIQEAVQKFREAERHLADVTATCKHVIDGTPDSWATCRICSMTFGWACDKSPDHVCHYFTDNSGSHEVKLRDGTFHTLPADHDYRYENSDSCLFCGQPEERK